MSSRMTSLGRDFTPLTEQCRKEAPPSVSTSPVTWYASSPIWKQQPKKKKLLMINVQISPPKSNKTLSDCWMLVVLLAVASDWTGRRSPASCSSHPCCKRRPRRLLPMKSTHGRGELGHRAQRGELWRERVETLGSGAGKQDSFRASQRRFFFNRTVE